MAVMGDGPDAPDGLREAKQALRARMRAVRSAISETDRIRRSSDVARRLLELPEAAGARRIFTFLSFGGEVSTEPVIAAFRDRGATVAVPVLEAGGMEAVDLPAGAALVLSGYGAMEPADRLPVDPAEIDLVASPGLAFDRTGRRLGYGGGYFDAFLPRLRPDCPVVGVCFAEQVVAEVPAGPGDRAVAVVVTDAEVIRPSEGDPLL
jgi:5-formyltetrahydrofolate cyclo-ligase